MKYQLIDKDEFTVVGMPVKVSLTDPEYQAKIMDLWKEFIPRVDEIKKRKSRFFYGLCNVSEGIKGDDCSFEHMAAVEVASTVKPPKSMKIQKVPKAKFFVVTHKGSLDKLGETYAAIEKEIKKKEFKEDRSKIFFELYDERYKENSDDSEIDIYSLIMD